MKEYTKLRIMVFILCASFFVIGFLSYYLYEQHQNRSISTYLKGDTNYSDYENCKNLSLQDTALCLREYVSLFYNFTVRDERLYIGNDGSLADVKKNGGDCYDYSKIYESIGKELGFSTYGFNIYNGELGHRFATIINNKGYCILDQLHDPFCFLFGRVVNGTVEVVN